MTEPLRVLQIVPNMHAAGLETLIMNIYRNIDRDKLQFDFLVHYKERHFYDDEIEKLGGHIYRLSFREDGNILKYLKDLNVFFGKHKYDIVHCHMASTAIFTLGFAKLYGVKYRILHSHNSNTDNTVKGRFKNLLLKISKIFANRYFSCGVEAGKFLYGNAKFEVIHNAIDIDTFSKAERKHDSVLDTLQGKFVIGHVGRFTVQKNHDFLINVFYEYHLINANSILVLIGEGELENFIKEKVDRLGIKDSVIFYGTSNHMERIYKWFNVFVLPSIFEGLPVVGVESQAAGIPCLYSDKITKEVGFTPLVSFLPIDKGSTVWVDELEKIRNSNYKSEDMTEYIRKAGYEIKTEALRIQKIYQSLLDKNM